MRGRTQLLILSMAVLFLLLVVAEKAHAGSGSLDLPSSQWAGDLWNWFRDIFNNFVGKVIAVVALIWFGASGMSGRWGMAIGAFIIFVIMAVASGLVDIMFGTS